jgi:MYXO-CTERM domain-containing protein
VGPFLVALLTVAAGPAAPAQAACTCRPAGVRANAQQADAVFTGAVSDQTRDTVGSGQQQRVVRRTTVDVDRIYQGEVTDTPVLVTSTAGASDCALPRMASGATWVFFVEGSGTTFRGDRCGGSREVSDEYLRVVEDVLGAGEVLVEPVAEPPPLDFTPVEVSATSPLSRLVAPGAAVALLGLLGLALVRRRSAHPGDH